MSEALSPCPFCGSDQVFVWKRPEAIPRYFIICPECKRDINGESTKQQAIAAWNRRASPSWSTEPPTEEGSYWLVLKTGNVNSWVFYAYIYEEGKQRFIESRCIQGRRLLKEFCETVPYPLQWLKIDVPAPPEESEVKHG